MNLKYITFIAIVIVCLMTNAVMAVDQGANNLIRAHVYGDDSATGQWSYGNFQMSFDDTDFIVTSTFTSTGGEWFVDLESGAGGAITTVNVDLPIIGDGSVGDPIDLSVSVAGYGLTMTTNYIDVEAGYGLDTTADSVLLDPTEVGTTTWGEGAAVVWTLDASAGTDPTLTFGDNIVTVGAANLGVSGSLFIDEQADAIADIAGFGQLWIDNSTPNSLWFTDDGGNDFQLGAGAANQDLWDSVNGTDASTTTSALTFADGGGGTSIAKSGDGTALTISIGNSTDDLAISSVSTENYIQAGTDFRLISTTANTGGGWKLMLSEATSGAMSGTTHDIEVDIPVTAKIVSCQLRVDTAVASSVAWNAAYIDGSTQAIGVALNIAKNTKQNTIFDVNTDTDITSAETDIRLTAVGDPFSGGVVRAIVYYYTFITMDDNP